jgi:NAD(P)-dependent dehydrogenase (short-subunit alcohol dehydrogenase family)
MTMQPDADLKDKVIVISGAGRGIGRDIAIQAGAAGANVVVNDIGTAADGSGGEKAPAAQVVEDIVAAGGVAVANYDSVATVDGAKAIVETAIGNFGRIDALVNNAGFLRDRIFHKMTPADFEDVVKVHLFGSFYMAHAAVPHMRNQEAGSIINITSTSGLIGNFGQANYSAAKMGIVGLSKSLALDLARSKIRSNCVAPFAWTRMVGTIPTETPEEKLRVERLKTMSSEKIAPFILYLASDLSAAVSGQIFGVRKNEIYLFNQHRPIRSVHRSEGWTPTSIAEIAIPALQGSFSPLVRSAEIFSWDPI